MTMKIQELHWTSSANAMQKHVKGKKGREKRVYLIRFYTKINSKFYILVHTMPTPFSVLPCIADLM